MNSAIVNLPVNLYLSGPSYINNAGQMLVAAVFATQPVGVIANGTAAKQYLVSPSNTAASPAISAVLNDASHLAGVSSATWIQILGQNLSSTTRSWTASDFTGNMLPTSLDGISVTVDGLPAYPESVSPTQIVVLAPDDAATGAVQVQVTNGQGTSAPFTVTKSDPMPALLNSQGVASSVNSPGAATAVHADGSPVCDPIIYGCTGRRAVPGETISIFGTGFGPTKTPTPADRTIPAPAELANPVSVSIGGKPATATYAALISSRLEQINVTIPEGLPYGNAVAIATIDSVTTPEYLYLEVGNGQPN